ncbi:uncharacterized protein L969DRAFT_80436 [Mixia osmundae IAM 14324]|uniref:Uncharacterized protein n=1 Tax=Mixia osmundae (strain CBS 9802 / IAM 14324 / JCM 22182 / KY 12970) TaxID=764103 RepID=G7E4G1_MIXOS|nr:uncharacterized protein L969DRAFT_80436 [Mixia osmundae IAM 14324]KEI36262.1 hypothetical protein L969DRAFT_80436 [Mixia osmundae IAM 14324]GAA97721.1 hypothetical protein E5Q_04400 [Mixia osmundae IAM 14324]
MTTERNSLKAKIAAFEQLSSGQASATTRPKTELKINAVKPTVPAASSVASPENLITFSPIAQPATAPSFAARAAPPLPSRSNTSSSTGSRREAPALPVRPGQTMASLVATQARDLDLALNDPLISPVAVRQNGLHANAPLVDVEPDTIPRYTKLFDDQCRILQATEIPRPIVRVLWERSKLTPGSLDAIWLACQQRSDEDALDRASFCKGLSLIDTELATQSIKAG